VQKRLMLVYEGNLYPTKSMTSSSRSPIPKLVATEQKIPPSPAANQIRTTGGSTRQGEKHKQLATWRRRMG
jgi:hypothetical protein